jgi:hypothetical protein
MAGGQERSNGGIEAFAACAAQASGKRVIHNSNAMTLHVNL